MVVRGLLDEVQIQQEQCSVLSSAEIVQISCFLQADVQGIKVIDKFAKDNGKAASMGPSLKLCKPVGDSITPAVEMTCKWCWHIRRCLHSSLPTPKCETLGPCWRLVQFLREQLQNLVRHKRIKRKQR